MAHFFSSALSFLSHLWRVVGPGPFVVLIIVLACCLAGRLSRLYREELTRRAAVASPPAPSLIGLYAAPPRLLSSAAVENLRTTIHFPPPRRPIFDYDNPRDNPPPAARAEPQMRFIHFRAAK